MTTPDKEPKFYLQIELSYNKEIIMPIEQGLIVADAMTSADIVDTSDYKQHTIGPNDGKHLTMKLLTADQVKAMKMAHVLLQKENNSD